MQGYRAPPNPRSSNGRTAAFGAVNRGSNPCRGATCLGPQEVDFQTPRFSVDSNAKPRRIYYEREPSMAAENLADLISKLTPQEQDSVKQFVEVLKGRASSQSAPFLAAVDEFIDQHPELLRRLAQ